jgi:hypothetical protein
MAVVRISEMRAPLAQLNGGSCNFLWYCVCQKCVNVTRYDVLVTSTLSPLTTMTVELLQQVTFLNHKYMF